MMKKPMHDTTLACSIYRTAAGFGAVLASEAGLVAHLLPYHADCEGTALERAHELCARISGENALTSEAARLLERYFTGAIMDFHLPLDFSGVTPFRQCVYRIVAAIPYGKVLSYAAVAAACDNPKGARAVGGAMANNPLPIFVPCHRVVGAGGVMTGFTAPGGIGSKRELLRMEGVKLDAAGRFCSGL